MKIFVEECETVRHQMARMLDRSVEKPVVVNPYSTGSPPADPEARVDKIRVFPGLGLSSSTTQLPLDLQPPATYGRPSMIIKYIGDKSAVSTSQVQTIGYIFFTGATPIRPARAVRQGLRFTVKQYPVAAADIRTIGLWLHVRRDRPD